MDKKYTSQYLSEIWNQSLKEVHDDLEIKVERKKLIIVLIVAGIVVGIILAPSILGINGYENLSNVIFAAVIGTVVTSLLIFIGLVCGARFIALINLFRVAAIRDYNLKEQIKTLEPVNPFEISISPPDRPKEGSINVGIDIYNSSTNSINFSVSVHTKTMSRSEILLPLQIYNSNSDKSNMTIHRNITRHFYFACAGIGWPNAVLNTTNDNSRKIEPGKYDLILILNGENHLGKPVSYSFKLLMVYDGDDKLELREQPFT